MTDITIREIKGAALIDIAQRLHAYSLMDSPPLESREDLQDFYDNIKVDDFGISLTLYEDEHPVSTATASDMFQTVRGKLFPIGGVWGVATHPAARRKGYVRQVMTQLFAAMKERGHGLTMLYAFRESFYQRMGYVAFPQPKKAMFNPQALIPLLKIEKPGNVELCLVGDGIDVYRDYLLATQARTHGMILSDEYVYPWIAKMNNNWLALARVNGQVVGMMTYTLKERVMAIYHFYPSNSAGKYLLLDWIARHTDQMERAEITLQPDTRPGTWFADMKVKTESLEPPLGRVLNVAEIGGMQTGAGRFTAKIDDSFCDWNNGIYAFETVDSVLTVQPASNADCDLSINGLSALVYGTHDPQDFSLRGWGNPDADTQAVMQQMFPLMWPYAHTRF